MNVTPSAQRLATARSSAAAVIRPGLHGAVTVALLAAAAATPLRAQTSQATPPDASLVAQLADAAQRASARRQLLAAGATALPLLVEALGDADVELVTAALDVLRELGPAAGDAFARVFALYCESTLRAPAALATMTELAPWRPADCPLTWNEVVAAENGLMRRDDADHARQWARFAARFRFPHAATIAELVDLLRSRSPHRAQLALQHLARRGPAATIALPALRDILQRPAPGVGDAAAGSLRDDAARAALAIAPTSDLAAMAREHLAGRSSAPAAREVPDRLRERLHRLRQELTVPATRETAAANLVALGDIAAAPLGDALATAPDEGTALAMLDVLQQFGDRGVQAVPGLLAALPVRDVSTTAAILRTLAATAARSDLTPDDLAIEIHPAPIAVLWRSHGLRGQADTAQRCEIAVTACQLHAVLAVDPGAPHAELLELLRSGDVFVRERVLAVLATRGTAPDVVAVVTAMLDEPQPPADDIERHFVHPRVLRGVDRTPFVRHAAARAVLALAAPDDAHVALARRVLAEGPPK